MNDEPEFVDAKTLGRMAGVSDATVSRWLQRGLIVDAVMPALGKPQWRIPLAPNRELIEQSKAHPLRRGRRRMRD
jgi:hypothetical protein